MKNEIFAKQLGSPLYVHMPIWKWLHLFVFFNLAVLSTDRPAEVECHYKWTKRKLKWISEWGQYFYVSIKVG